MRRMGVRRDVGVTPVTVAARDDGFMRDSDAFSWYMEDDPALRSTVVVVAWLDRSPDWDRLVHRFDVATSQLPAFRRRPIGLPARLATPRWTADPDFDLSLHVRRVGAPPPYTDETVIDLARAAATSGFDRARPLWAVTLVEGLLEGRAAMVLKMHHSLTDGVGGVQMAMLLYDREADPTDAGDTAGGAGGAVPDRPPAETPGVPAQVVGALNHAVSRAAGDARSILCSLLPTGRRLLLHPTDVAGEVLETARSVVRTVRPATATLSPVMTGRGLGRHLAVLDVGLDDLKAAARAADGSVNDGFLAVVTGGLRRYHERHGAPVGDLLVTVPISLRTPDDPIGGNRITLQRVRVPVGVADPAERIRAIGAVCRAARHERSLPLTEAIAAVLNLLPPGVVGGMLKHVDLVASDVPGFPFPVHLAGARVTGQVAFGPTIGTALNVTLFSYDGCCHIGVTVDTAAVPDHEVLMDCLREGVAETLALAAVHGNGTRPKKEVGSQC